MKSGIYRIRNLTTDDFYIGSSCNFITRKSDHFRRLIRNKHFNNYLQNSFNKYGKLNFVFEILVTCPKEYLIKLEQWFIDNLKPNYNICVTAGSHLGVKRSSSTKLKMKNSHKGRKKEFNNNPIISKNLKNNEIKEFNSTIEASRFYQCHPISITRVLTGKRYSNNGFKFYYKNKVSRNNNKLIENNNKEGEKFRKKLTEDQVKEIKILLKEQKQGNHIAKLYGVNEVTIGQIKNNKIWKTI